MMKKIIIAIVVLLALGAALYVTRQATYQSQNSASIERGVNAARGEGISHVRDANRRPSQPASTGARQR